LRCLIFHVRSKSPRYAGKHAYHSCDLVSSFAQANRVPIPHSILESGEMVRQMNPESLAKLR
jgi:hypothetical protein